MQKMLQTGIWNGGLSDESVEGMTNSNLHVMRFLGLSMEDDVPDHSVLSRFRTRLTAAGAWDRLLNQINRQIQVHDITVRKGCYVDASITQSPRKPKRTFGSQMRWFNAKTLRYRGLALAHAWLWCIT
ncbi:MAG: transposase [Gammaproteobacteria bacterium]|nr:MAG: transposase [Gammaproteobacteria bacterium]